MLTKLIDKFTSKTPPELLCNQMRNMPRAYFDWRKDNAFGKLVRYAYKNSRFYKRKFDELKINPARVKTPKELGDFTTMPEDISNYAEEFLCQKPEIVFESSGTTGKNKRVYFTQSELESIGRYNAAGFFGWGLDRNDRFVNAFDFSIWIPGMVTQKGIEKAKIFSLAAGKVDPMEVYKRIPVYHFNVILGEPTWLIKLTEIAEKHGSYPLKMLVAGAEAMPEAARAWMEKVWQGAKVRLVYGTVESGGTIAFELDSLCQNYHVNENNFYVEIFQPGADSYGELVFTTLDRTTMPLIRYRNRDITKIIEEKCVCGLPYRKLAKIRGRADEIVVASGGNLYPLLFENFLKDIPEITSDWQVVFKLDGIKEIMEFNLEAKNSAQSGLIEQKIMVGIQSRCPDLWKNSCLGTFKTTFVHHVPGSLRKTRKLIRLVDQRDSSLLL